MIDYLNEKLNNLPPHLKKFMVPQNYEEYTPVNHAVWRYVMRQNVNYLKTVAHKSYLDGLGKTGITLDCIPSVKEMNEILGTIDWAACTVDGFIHPQAFMEFQEHNVLVIAADIRQINHIEYTPAPDIIHEAAGHAPIIADPEYAEYLRKFGEIGRKAFSSGKDFELFEAIRHLSIIKEDPYTPEVDIQKGEAKIEELAQNLGDPSEMSLIRRLHWWTVEYGLIGTLENPKIYGAGLLSSIGESVGCMKPDVKKIPYTLDAKEIDFDITKPQPQLFVTTDFKHLSTVLDQFADTMALRRGGLYGLTLAKDSCMISTVVYSSGLAVTGTLSDFIENNGLPAYITFSGPVSISDNKNQFANHGVDYHKEGFGSPCGKLVNSSKSPELLTDAELSDLNIKVGRLAELVFDSGVNVKGMISGSMRNLDGNLMLLSFTDCTVSLGERVLFQPEWGTYDMAIGSEIVSVYAGVPNPYSFVPEFKMSEEKTHKINYDANTRSLFELYAQVRNCRDTQEGFETLTTVEKKLCTDFPEDWLCATEILEILCSQSVYPELQHSIRQRLQSLQQQKPELSKLISDGFKLLPVKESV